MAFISMMMAALFFILLAVGIIVSIIGFILLGIYLARKSKKKSKGVFIASVVALAIGLPIAVFCSFLFAHNVKMFTNPDEIIINNVTYRTGFYGDLYPINIIRTGEKYMVNDKDVYAVNYDRFDFMQYSDGTTTYGNSGIDGGQIYCNLEQYDEAKAFYEAPENFLIKCKIGDLSDNVIENFDYKKFEDLYSFSQKPEYSPLLDQDQNMDVVRFRVDSFKDFYEKELTIYKESIDGFFASTKGTHYQIMEGTLYLVIHYDHGHGEYNELVCVPIPNELSDYVVKMVSGLTE